MSAKLKYDIGVACKVYENLLVCSKSYMCARAHTHTHTHTHADSTIITPIYDIKVA